MWVTKLVQALRNEWKGRLNESSVRSIDWVKKAGHRSWPMKDLRRQFFPQGLFIYFRERAQTCQGGWGGQREGERISRRLPARHRAQRPRVPSQDPEITTWAETQSRTLSQLCHPGDPEKAILKVRDKARNTGIFQGTPSACTFTLSYWPRSITFSLTTESLHCPGYLIPFLWVLNLG